MICRTHRFSGVEDAEHWGPALLKVPNVEVQLSDAEAPLGRSTRKTDGRPGGRKTAGCRFSATAACNETYVNTNPDVRLRKTGTRFVYRFSVDSLQIK
jgi:hypothetical protein